MQSDTDLTLPLLSLWDAHGRALWWPTRLWVSAKPTFHLHSKSLTPLVAAAYPMARRMPVPERESYPAQKALGLPIVSERSPQPASRQCPVPAFPPSLLTYLLLNYRWWQWRERQARRSLLLEASYGCCGKNFNVRCKQGWGVARVFWT